MPTIDGMQIEISHRDDSAMALECMRVRGRSEGLRERSAELRQRSAILRAALREQSATLHDRSMTLREQVTLMAARAERSRATYAGAQAAPDRDTDAEYHVDLLRAARHRAVP